MGFISDETKRQIAFKRRHWPELPDGSWSKKPELTYPHILPTGEIAKALYEPIWKDVLTYCEEEKIAVHSEILNLRSSQACCFNFLFPLRKNPEVASKVFRPFFPGMLKVDRIEFEYAGDEGATEWLGEPTGGQRGQNRTSIDAAIFWISKDQERVCSLCEWKYTEPGFGTCGGYASRGNKNKESCENIDLGRMPSNACYLTKGRNRRTYWDRIAQTGIDITRFKTPGPCPFMGPFYQLMRQYLLVEYIRKHEKHDRVEVISIGFKGNSGPHTVPPDVAYLGGDTISAWNAVLSGVPPLRHIYADDIASSIRQCPEKTAQRHAEYLDDRYGV